LAADAPAGDEAGKLPGRPAPAHRQLADAPRVRVYGPEPRAFLGSAHITGGELIPDRLLSPVELQSWPVRPACPN
jgi:tRNA pseudouridine55 synthase